MRKHVARLHSARGQTMAEYGVVLALITLVVVAGLMVLSGSLSAALEAVAGVFP